MTVTVFGSRRNNSVNTAAVRGISSNLIRIIHPFHPFTGRQLHYVGVRYNRHGKRLLLRADALTICSVPPQWTYLVDVLQRISEHPASRVAELTPRQWKHLFAASPMRSDIHEFPV